MHWNFFFTKEQTIESLKKAPFYEERLKVFEEHIHSSSIAVLQNQARRLKDVASIIARKPKKLFWNDNEFLEDLNLWIKKQKRLPHPFLKSSKCVLSNYMRLAVLLLKELNRYQEPELWLKKIYEDPRIIRNEIAIPFYEERRDITLEYIELKSSWYTLRRVLKALDVAAQLVNAEPNDKEFTKEDIVQIINTWWSSCHTKPALSAYTHYYRKMMIELIKRIGRYKQTKDILYEYKDIIESSLKDKELSQVTVEKYRKYMRFFLSFLVSRGTKLSDLTAKDIQSFYSHIEHWSPKSQSGLLCYLRYWLKECESKRIIQSHLANLIVVPRIWKYSSVPCVYDWSTVKKIIDIDNQNSKCRLRDKAILLLLSTYGLRSSEICSMTLDDINWDTSSFSIKHTKNYTYNNYPLEANTGNAIADYLLKERPVSVDRHLFLQCNRTKTPITIYVVEGIVSNRIEKLGIVGKRKGAHSIRHSMATHLLETGVSRKEISDILGHKNYKSLQYYAKVSKTALRSVVMDKDLEDLI